MMVMSGYTIDVWFLDQLDSCSCLGTISRPLRPKMRVQLPTRLTSMVTLAIRARGTRLVPKAWWWSLLVQWN